MTYIIYHAYDNMTLIDKNDKFEYQNKIKFIIEILKSFRLCGTVDKRSQMLT